MLLWVQSWWLCTNYFSGVDMQTETDATDGFFFYLWSMSYVWRMMNAATSLSDQYCIWTRRMMEENKTLEQITYVWGGRSGV